MSRAAGERRSDTLVIVPALNETATIDRILTGLATTAPELEVVVIDDGSRDDTAARARARGALVVSHPFNLGYGAALQTGYKHATRAGYSYVVQMDADGQHDPADVPRLLAPLRSGIADVVIGSRFIAPSGYRMGAMRGAGRVFFQRMLSLCGGPRVTDPTSGFQALGRRAFAACCADAYPSDFPDIDVLLLLHRHGIRILEVPVEMAPNPATHAPMHTGTRAIYYTYKMLLAMLRSALGQPLAPAPDGAPTAARSVEADDGPERA